MKRPFHDLYAGWTYSERSAAPVSHIVIEFNTVPVTVACSAPTHSMHQLKTFPEPKGEVCPRCADYVRKQLLSRVVELANARTPLTPADAQTLLVELAQNAKVVS